MQLCGKNKVGKILNQMQSELKESLEAEKKMDELLKIITASSTCEEEMERIIMFVPFIIHCENLFGLKILNMFLLKVLATSRVLGFQDRKKSEVKKSAKICL